MKKQISYPKIVQFRNVISSIRRRASFVGLDENENPIYDKALKLPKLSFRGTVKLHGTNAGVCYNNLEGMWCQSRNGIITPEKDNAGFAFFVEAREWAFQKMFNFISMHFKIDMSKNTISIYGEWAGRGIQKGVAISEIDKSLFIFGVKITPHDEGVDSYWVNVDELGIQNPKEGIYDINSFDTYEVDIDFNQPELIQEQLIKLTEKVEKQCPVAAAFNKDGIGEGIVWSTQFMNVVYRFKVKGDKHSVSKVKKLASVDVEKIKNIREFVDYAMTENRFKQSLQEVFEESERDIKQLGDLIRWNVNDITKEEIDTMHKNGLEPRDVNKYIASKVKEYFKTVL